MSEPVPWLPHLATAFLGAIVRPDMTVFEWGCGGSTLWFADRVTRVISIEHNAEWQIEDRPNVEFRHIPPEAGELGNDPSNPFHYRSLSMGGVDFRDYCLAINDVYGHIDLIFIDGRARASCLYHAQRRIRPGGYIVLDNAERGYYLDQTLIFFEGWNRAAFYGDGPENNYKWETVVWQAPNE